MNSNTFRMPARRTAALAAAVALAAGPVLLTAPAAHATGTGSGAQGQAGAVVLRTGLDVNLLNKTVSVPLKASLNEVKAPASARKTALSVRLDGVDQGKPFSVLRADVATASATVTPTRAEGFANLAKARVHLPGLPLLSLIEVEKVTSKAVCEKGRQPVAESNVLGHVTVLGKKVKLTAGGRTKVTVPGVGEVTLDLSRTRTTSTTAAATALELKVSVNPLNLNVAEVEGVVTLAEATCTAPRPGGKPTEQPSAPPSQEPDDASGTNGSRDTGITAQGGEPTANLAETGGSSATPYVTGGALLLVGAGAGALALNRRARVRG
ncbi:SCO1860 family LAETG-anchored protein [Streptomyces purpureus]|uniref:SCO1860 family LAETG-anchored protein n=1 Tax=Streptomyces purpureus TaxID=1951 RepID=UPI00378AF9F9